MTRTGSSVRSAAPFWLVHVVAFVTPFLTDFTPAALAWVAGMYLVRMFGVTAGYHRYFAHRTFKTSRAMQFVLAVLATSSVQKGVLWWAAHHRRHHKHSDGPEDVHSPRHGLWWSHVGWILCGRFDATDYDRIRDFAVYPELRWLNEHHWTVEVATPVVLLAVGGLEAMLWGFFVSTVLLWHGTFFVNSLAHVIGRQRFATNDDSRNSLLIALVTLGEGWHNNHHYFQSATRQGFYWWQIDVTYYVLRAMAWVRLVRDLREPPARVLAEGRRRAPVTAPAHVAPQYADGVPDVA